MTAPAFAGVRALYICYFGLREPLVQTQVLPYVRELAAAGAKMFLLTFEPERRKRWTDDEIAQTREQLRADGIEWVLLSYHKRPTLPATLFDVLAGTIRSIALARRHDIQLMHCRSHVAALIGALTKRFTGAKLIFDFRGLMADEYVESGNWPANGFLYRLTKRFERFLLRAADGLVVLTERARQELFASEAQPIEVVPCCIDPARFANSDSAVRDGIRESHGIRDRTVIVYAGSLGEMYMPREMAAFFAAARTEDPRVFPFILTQSRPEIITAHLAAHDFAALDYFIGYVNPEQLPGHLAASDIAISFVRPTWSKLASSPTKFAEYLASGLPVLSTRGIGDMDEQIVRDRVGVLLDGFDATNYGDALRKLEELRRDDRLKERCRALAAEAYDLHTTGAARYVRLYQRVADGT